MRRCVACQTEIVADDDRRRYCSLACRRKVQYAKRAERDRRRYAVNYAYRIHKRKQARERAYQRKLSSASHVPCQAQNSPQ